MEDFLDFFFDDDFFDFDDLKASSFARPAANKDALSEALFDDIGTVFGKWARWVSSKGVLAPRGMGWSTLTLTLGGKLTIPEP